MTRPLTITAILAVACLSAGATCAGASANNIQRSERELDLAAGLHSEGNRPGALQQVRIAIELDPENARAHFLLGFLHMERPNYEEAEPHLRRSVELLVEQDDNTGATLAEIRNVYGLCLFYLERFNEAIEVLNESAIDLLNVAPHLAWGNLGLAYHASGQPDEAIDALNEALRRQSRFCVGYYRLGRIYFEQEQFNLAEEAFTGAVTADDTCDSYQAAYRMRGEVRARLQLREEAISDFERCVELESRNEDGRTCQRYLESTL